jgi:hypothetical protein
MIKPHGSPGSRDKFREPGSQAQTGLVVYAIQYESYGS